MGSESRGSSSAWANCWVSPMRWLVELPQGRQPGVRGGGASEVSTRMGKGPKKSRANREAGCMLRMASRVVVKDFSAPF